MKILFISAQYPPEAKGGGELSTHIIAQGLQKLGHIVHVITDGEIAERKDVDNVHVRALPLGLKKKPLFERAHSIAASRMLKRNVKNIRDYDIVHAHDFRSALMLSHLELPNAVVTARDYAQISGCTNNMQYDGNITQGCQGMHEFWQCHRVHEASWARKPFRIWQYMYNKTYRKKAFASFKHQIFISDAEKRVIAKYQNITRQHTAVIHNPISEEYLSEPLQKGVAGNILYIGRVEMYKGVLLLLRAWKNVATAYPHAHLTIAGNGAQQKEYEALTAVWGLGYKTTFLPHVPYHQLRPMIDKASIIAAPHVWVEPFGRTVIEGMARGKIVVAANVGGPAEIITDTATGLLFKRNSQQDLERALSQALDMGYLSAQEMGVAARNFVRDHLNMKVIAKQHEEFYKEIII